MNEAGTTTAPLYTLSEIAAETGIPLAALDRYRRSHGERVPSIVLGETRRYPEAAVDAFRAIHQQQAEDRPVWAKRRLMSLTAQLRKRGSEAATAAAPAGDRNGGGNGHGDDEPRHRSSGNRNGTEGADEARAPRASTTPAATVKRETATPEAAAAALPRTETVPIDVSSAYDPWAALAGLERSSRGPVADPAAGPQPTPEPTPETTPEPTPDRTAAEAAETSAPAPAPSAADPRTDAPRSSGTTAPETAEAGEPPAETPQPIVVALRDTGPAGGPSRPSRPLYNLQQVAEQTGIPYTTLAFYAAAEADRIPGVGERYSRLYPWDAMTAFCRLHAERNPGWQAPDLRPPEVVSAWREEDELAARLECLERSQVEWSDVLGRMLLELDAPMVGVGR